MISQADQERIRDVAESVAARLRARNCFYPDGCCVEATHALHDALVLEFPNIRHVEGAFTDTAPDLSDYHCWLELDDTIIDPTASQFEEFYDGPELRFFPIGQPRYRRGGHHHLTFEDVYSP